MTKIKVTWEDETYPSVSEAVCGRVTKHDGGELERMDATLTVLVQFVAALTEHLCNKGVIAEEEIEKILPPWC